MTLSTSSAIDGARAEASRASAHGAPWLLAYGSTLAVAAVVSFVTSVEVTALVTLFQGGVALPLAFLLERRLGTGRLTTDHPLSSLLVQVAMVQSLAMPAVLLMYATRPELVAATLAAIAGGHFLPYVWLHRTRIYLILGLAVSLGSWAMTAVIRARPDRAVLTWWTACYLVAAVLLLRLDRARQRSAEPSIG